MLFGVVPCATTQLADNNRIENSVALALIAVLRLRCDFVSSVETVGAITVEENPIDPLGG